MNGALWWLWLIFAAVGLLVLVVGAVVFWKLYIKEEVDEGLFLLFPIGWGALFFIAGLTVAGCSLLL